MLHVFLIGLLASSSLLIGLGMAGGSKVSMAGIFIMMGFALSLTLVLLESH